MVTNHLTDPNNFKTQNFILVLRSVVRIFPAVGGGGQKSRWRATHLNSEIKSRTPQYFFGEGGANRKFLQRWQDLLPTPREKLAKFLSVLTAARTVLPTPRYLLPVLQVFLLLVPHVSSAYDGEDRNGAWMLIGRQDTRSTAALLRHLLTDISLSRNFFSVVLAMQVRNNPKQQTAAQSRQFGGWGWIQ